MEKNLKFGIGQPIKRLEDSKFLTGNGKYNDDINFKDQVYMHIIRSPYSFAKIISIDYKKAEEKKGVLKILSNDLIKDMQINPMYPLFKVKNKDGSDMKNTFRNILADQKVRYVGEPILAIIAETIEVAEEAADLIDIEYDEMKSTTSIKNAIKNSAPIVRDELSNNICFDWELGNIKNKPSSFWENHFRDKKTSKRWMSLPITGKLKDISDKSDFTRHLFNQGYDCYIGQDNDENPNDLECIILQPKKFRSVNEAEITLDKRGEVSVKRKGHISESNILGVNTVLLNMQEPDNIRSIPRRLFEGFEDNGIL